MLVKDYMTRHPIMIPPTTTPSSVPEVIEPQPRMMLPLEPAPAPEELALTMEIESETDLEVIEMLDWLETLGEIESS